MNYCMKPDVCPRKTHPVVQAQFPKVHLKEIKYIPKDFYLRGEKRMLKHFEKKKCYLKI